MKKWAWIATILLVVLGGGFAWFWSLGSLPAEEPTHIALRIDRAPVQVRLQETGAFQEATNGMFLSPGATVKTGAGGQASIVFFDRAESRLDADSEITISVAAESADATNGLDVRLQLGAGRVWSRVLRLFDLGSSFSVKTSSVVATVRGTAFDVRANPDRTTEVWVSDSAVTVDDASKGGSTSAESASASMVVETTATIMLNGKPLDGGRLARPEVRRVAFDVLQTGAVVSSTNPVVSMEEVGTGIPAGQSAFFGADGRLVRHGAITGESRSSTWFTKNRAADEVFFRTIRDGQRAALRRLGGSRPDQPTDVLTRFSEMLHQRASGGDDQGLAERYLARRLARIIELADAGKAGQALQIFARVEQEIRGRVSGADSAAERTRVRAALVRISLLTADASPRSALYPFKQRFEDLAVSLEDDPVAALFARLLIIDARLDEASHLLDDGVKDEARTALDAARGGIENARREATAVLASAKDHRRPALIGKLLALVVREAAERARLDEGRVPFDPLSSASSTEPGVPTSTVPGMDGAAGAVPGSVNVPKNLPPLPVKTTPTSTNPSGTPEFTSVAVYLQPTPVGIGESATLYVVGTRADGSKRDVTAQSTFKLTQGSATIAGTRVTPTAGSSVIITATYSDQGTMRTATGILTVTAAAILDRLNVTPAKSSIAAGASTALTVIAYYSNGFTKDVSGSVSWNNLTPALGSMAGNVFTAVAQTTGGTVSIVATYTDGGVAKSMETAIAVAPTPASTRLPSN